MANSITERLDTIEATLARIEAGMIGTDPLALRAVTEHDSADAQAGSVPADAPAQSEAEAESAPRKRSKTKSAESEDAGTLELEH